MTWVLVIGAGWLLLALLVAVVIGRSVRLADARAAQGSEAEQPNFVVDPAAAPRGGMAATVLPFPPAGVKNSPEPLVQPTPRDTPTVPGIPAARPPAPGAGNGSQSDPIRRSSLG